METYQAENREEIRKVNEKLTYDIHHNHPVDLSVPLKTPPIPIVSSVPASRGTGVSGAEEPLDLEDLSLPLGIAASVKFGTTPGGGLLPLQLSPSSRPLHPSHLPSKSNLYNHRIILTTYPGQVGVNPIPLTWGHSDPNVRGPIVASRAPSSLKVRNSIGAHGGSYCIYRALAVAIGDLEPDHKPDFHNTEPVCKIGPHPSWGNRESIVSIDPYGHIVTDAFRTHIKNGLDVRPTIAVTKAHMRVPEIEQAVKEGHVKVDGLIVLNQEAEIVVTKAAIEPVWWLPGVAKRFEVDETTMRRCLLYVFLLPLFK